MSGPWKNISLKQLIANTTVEKDTSKANFFLYGSAKATSKYF